jgi:hypothetical protein
MRESAFRTPGHLINMKTDTYGLFGQNDGSDPVAAPGA